MSTSSNVSLGALRIQVRQRSDMENNFAVSDPEINQYISQSAKELRDLLTAAYGDDYYVAPNYQFTTGNSQLYPLPDGTPTYLDVNGNTAKKFYKLLGVDLRYSNSPTGWISIRRFEFIERNKLAYPNTAGNYFGYTNMRYRVEGNNLMFIPVPQQGQLVQLWYIPAPDSLQYMLSCGTTQQSPNITLADTTGLSAGMNVFASNYIPSGTTILSLGSTSAVLSSNISATQPTAILSFWDDSTTLDGIAGWEEYVIIDAAIKIQIKQENPIDALAAERQAMTQRIQDMANGRDAGQAQHVSDMLAINGGYDGMGNGGWGGDGLGY